MRATFTVEGFPGRRFPAEIIRVDRGANAEASAAASAGSVVADTAVLSVQNPDLTLRPGMTATADIVTSEERAQLLVPNAAHRFSPARDTARASRGDNGGATSVFVHLRGRRCQVGCAETVTNGRAIHPTV